MEKAIFKNGIQGFIIPNNLRLEKFWMCDYNGHTFEYHNNLWMEV